MRKQAFEPLPRAMELIENIQIRYLTKEDVVMLSIIVDVESYGKS